MAIVTRRTARIEVVRLRVMHTASVRVTSSPRLVWRTVKQIHQVVMDAIAEQGLAPAGPLFARYHRIGLQVDVEAGIPLAQSAQPDGVVQPSFLPGGKASYLLQSGGHDALVEAHDALEAYRSDHGLRSAGGPWECYLIGPLDGDDTATFLTAIYLPIR